MNRTNKQVIVAKRASGIPTEDVFTLTNSAAGPCPDGGVVVRVHYATVDPGMRGWLSAQKNYMTVPDGAVMRSHGVGEIVESRAIEWEAGDLVAGWMGWQQFAVVQASDLLWKIDQDLAPITAWAGILGLNGLTAWAGFRLMADPHPGEVIVVTTAAGAVGGVVGQLAVASGLRAVGITGGLEKALYAEQVLGFAEVIDYQSDKDIGQAISNACPNGVDIFFDNTGGPLADDVFPFLKVGARVIQCGTSSISSWSPTPSGPRRERDVLAKRLTWRGLLVFDHAAQFAAGREELVSLFAAGRLAQRDHILEGLEAAPAALSLLFAGKNKGRLLIKISEL
jgi:NADPH-dependent curcumin reductase CurA